MSEADVIYKWLVLFALVPAALFPLVYGVSVPWWRSWIGRGQMALACGVLMLLLFSVFFYWFGPNYSFRNEFRIIGMSLLGVALYVVFFAMVREVFGGRRARTP